MYIKLNEEKQTYKYAPETTEFISGYNKNIVLMETDGYIDIAQDLINMFNNGMAVIKDNNIIQNVNALSYVEAQVQNRKIYFEQTFIKTSIGNIRINTAWGEWVMLMANFSAKVALIGYMPANKFILYKDPDFTKELTNDYIKTLQKYNDELTKEQWIYFTDEVENELRKIVKEK